MDIALEKLHFTFTTKPLLIGGLAMQYYGLRKSGADVDLVISAEDHRRLVQQYPDHVKDLWGDIGVCEYEFEIWNNICLFGYEYLAPGALELPEYRIIALDKLLFLKTLAMKEEKYRKDVELIVKKILDEKYAAWWQTLSPQEQKRRLAGMKAQE